MGFETSDDAAVVRLNDDTAAVLTVDFFTPIVDDPYDFGRVTAANSLSDVFAMGAKPIAALNMLAFSCALGADVVGAVMQGGNDKVREAGALIVGGHTIEDDEPKYGMAVYGLVHPDKVVRNTGSKPGDVLFLTKPLGTGIMTTALKSGALDDEGLRPVVDSMAELNKAGAEAMVEIGVNAATDITGFGLIGHLHEMMESSGTSAVVEWAAVPRFDGATEFAAQWILTGRGRDITRWAKDFAIYELDTEVMDDAVNILSDPQTSGGLLISVDSGKADALEALLEEKLGRPAARIGVVESGEAGMVRVI